MRRAQQLSDMRHIHLSNSTNALGTTFKGPRGGDWGGVGLEPTGGMGRGRA